MSREPELDQTEYLPLAELLQQDRRIRWATRLVVIGAVGLLLAIGAAIAALITLI